MTKEYRAYGCILMTAVTVNGRKRDIEFSPVSGYEGRSGSRYITDNEEIQEKLESSRRFGRDYELVKINGIDASTFTEETLRDAEQLKAAVEKGKEQAPEQKKVHVASLSDAKLYLQENYGWEPSGRVTKAMINSAAEIYGIVFE